MSEHFNVVLITIDAWRADFIRRFGQVPLVTAVEDHPHAVFFERAYANGPWTTPGLVSIHTGETPHRHGVHYAWSAPRPGSPAVAKILSEAGFSCPNLVYLNAIDNYANLGYRRESSPDYPRSPLDDPLTPALGVTREPYFLWFHYKWIHLPWWASAAHREAVGLDPEGVCERVMNSVATQFVVPKGEFKLEEQDRHVVSALYAACVREMNDWLEGVLQAIASGPGGDRTCVVLTSDHGDELLEHGHVGHASTAHNASLFEEVLRIPLIVIDPRVSGPKRVTTRVQGIDLFSTLLALAGVEPPLETQSLDLTPAIFGPSDALEALAGRCFSFHSSRAGYLTPREHEGHVLSGLSDGDFKCVERRYGAPVERSFYDLRADPLERSPLSAAALRHRSDQLPEWVVGLLDAD